MVIGARLAERISASGLSFSAVARKVGVKQPTISRLVHGEQQSSVHLHKIARVLNTTPEYLSGESDEPERGQASEPPPEVVQFVQLSVALPSERALAQMFEGMLEIIAEYPQHPDLEETARLLAHWLPTGLSQLRDLSPEGQTRPDLSVQKELAEALAISDRGSRS